MTKVMIFGTFDGIHPGHEYMIGQAEKLGDELIAVVTADEVVRALKGRSPKDSAQERINALAKLEQVDKVVQGDQEIGTYSVVKDYKPDVIAFGYDQQELKKNFLDWSTDSDFDIATKTLKAFHPDKYKSSLLRNYD